MVSHNVLTGPFDSLEQLDEFSIFFLGGLMTIDKHMQFLQYYGFFLLICLSA